MGKKLVTDWVVDRWVNLPNFYSKQEPQDSGCIEWTGVKNNIGYGFVGFNYPKGQTSPSGHRGGMMTSHRLAFMIAHGRLPNKRNVNHTCHNRLCVNPDHLVEGTQQEKIAAMVKDGVKRGWELGVPRGRRDTKQSNRKYLYTEKEIQWVRTAASLDIAKKYNIDKQRASAMRYSFRKNYTWLPCPPIMVKHKPGRPKKQ